MATKKEDTSTNLAWKKGTKLGIVYKTWNTEAKLKPK